MLRALKAMAGGVMWKPILDLVSSAVTPFHLRAVGCVKLLGLFVFKRATLVFLEETG